MISNKKSVQYLHKFCLDLKMLDWVISPGSRNAPITLTIGNDKRFVATPIVDERSAAFVALGRAIKAQRPVVLSCTSGSAALNYAPAIAEAFYQEVPLLVITADRPQKWINNGEGQSIDQINVFTNYCLESFHLDEDASEDVMQNTFDKIAQILTGNRKGPVHLNLAFEEPLYGKLDVNPIDYRFKSNVFHFDDFNPVLSDEFLSKRKIMVLVGQMEKSEEIGYLLEELLSDTRIVVLLETNANLYHPKFVNCIDRTLPSINLTQFWPDLVITIGGAIVSKRIKKFLRSVDGLEHWHIAESGVFPDVFERLSHKITAPPASVLRYFKDHAIIDAENDFQTVWLQRSLITQEKHFDFLADLCWSDLKAHAIIHDWIPENSVLHQGNSSVVRYFQLFDPIRSVTYLSNRGVSGIDGCVSTAIGYASMDDHLNILVVGDLSFLYDSNAWWNKLSKSNLLVIIINNGGGGIFKIIEGPEQSGVLDEFFEVRSNVEIEYLAKAHRLNYSKINDASELDNEMRRIAQCYADEAFSGSILEVDTISIESDQVLKAYFSYVNS